MAEKFVSERNLRFLLYDVFDIDSLTQYPYYREHNREIFDMVLDTAMKIGRDLLRPYFQEMDKNPPQYVDGQVKVHPAMKQFMKECGEGGWIGMNAPMEVGGQQLPLMLSFACKFIFSAANYSAMVYPLLTDGAAHLIETFGTEDLKKIYLPNMYSGKWQGTMALTEPQAGSSVGDIMTTAEPTDEGYYKIKGQKIFISASDHDAVENVVHLMLARIKGAPPGVKGISLFVVPKYRPAEDGGLVFNDVSIAGLYHKLGYRGSPITQMSMGENDDCRGWLVGEPNRGLACMFQMMNEQRIDVGLGASGIASAAYYTALEYAKERTQGRPLSDKDPSNPQIPIVRHPDVKRMLLYQRAIVEGSLSLLFQCARYADLERVLEGEEKEKYSMLLDLLTPVAKSYPAEMCILSVSQALQVLGGYGYCDEFPVEQHYRDVRIHPIHEGTTGIQGQDLLGRKVRINGGKAFDLFVEEVQRTMDLAGDQSRLGPYVKALGQALEDLKVVTGYLVDLAGRETPEVFLADATLYLEFFGIVSVAWQWLKQGIYIVRRLDNHPGGSEADLFNGKFYALRFFFSYELPKIEGLAERLSNNDGLTVEMKAEYFSD
ncbi:MAG: acyl-CoA dehydrogenase [Deltaproteobacteria bacterium]|nr:acyl-CoA dehydrogenase [Deltaproteobacteria bacterium]